jgi:hypothetical protein
VNPVDITKNFQFIDNEVAIAISSTGTRSGALSSNGRLFTWGDNSNGGLGNYEYTDLFIPTEINDFFDLTDGESIESFQVGWHSFAITSLGRMFTWGSSLRGELGNNSRSFDNTRSSFPFPVDITNNFDLKEG